MSRSCVTRLVQRKHRPEQPAKHLASGTLLTPKGQTRADWWRRPQLFRTQQ